MPFSLRNQYITFGVIVLTAMGVAAYLYISDVKARNPSKTPGSFAMAKNFLYEEKYGEARQELDKVLKQDPRDVKALGLMGTLYYRQGNAKLAYQYWTAALKIAPNEPTLRGLVSALERDRLQSGPLYHMEIQTSEHAPDWERHFTQGQNLYLRGDYPRAIEELRKAANLKPAEPKIYFVMGATYLKMNNRNETILAWEKALELNPGDLMTRELLTKAKRTISQKGG